MRNHFDNDADLIAGLLGGNSAAFEAYFHTCYPRLYRFALRRLGRPALAEEVAQEAIVKGLAKLESFRGEASLLTWLCGICRGEIATARRRHPELEQLHPVVEDDPSARAVLELLAKEAPWPEALLRREQTIALVQSILDCLPSLYGDVLEWKYVDGLSVAEIAARVGRSEKAIESMLTRARDAFRSALEELFSERAELIRGHRCT
jgi:RNA polymerase sigma-70 factor (ECF subfamily)